MENNKITQINANQVYKILDKFNPVEREKAFNMIEYAIKYGYFLANNSKNYNKNFSKSTNKYGVQLNRLKSLSGLTWKQLAYILDINDDNLKQYITGSRIPKDKVKAKINIALSLYH